MARYTPYSSYKPSGVAWLNEIPEHWSTNKLRYIFSFGKGLTITKEHLLTEGIPCISYGEVHSIYGFEVDPQEHFLKCVDSNYLKSSPNSLLKNGDLIFADTSEDIDGSGNFSQLTSNSSLFAGYHTIIARPLDRHSNRFYAYLMDCREIRTQIRHSVKGVKVFSITQAILRGVKIWLPPLTERQNIAEFLDHETAKIDSLIEKQQQLIKLLKEKRQAVISHAVTKGLNPEVPMKDSGVEWLGQVPEHWTVSRAKFFSSIFVPQRNKPDINNSGGIAWATMENMKQQYITEVSTFISKEAAVKSGSKVLKAGAVIASCVGNFGVTSINKIDVIINQQLQAFRPLGINAEYLQAIVSLSKSYFELIGTAATLVYVNQEGFENLPVIVPPENEQELICEFVSKEVQKFIKLIAKSEKKVELLNERRSALISAAVTGKIDVRHWQPPQQQNQSQHQSNAEEVIA